MDKIMLKQEDAKNFKITRRGLLHECYVECCSWEEVREGHRHDLPAAVRKKFSFFKKLEYNQSMIWYLNGLLIWGFIKYWSKISLVLFGGIFIIQRLCHVIVFLYNILPTRIFEPRTFLYRFLVTANGIVNATAKYSRPKECINHFHPSLSILA